MFSEFFIDRPIFASVLSILIVIAGAVSVFVLPISQYPDITPPTVVVQAYYFGADPKVLAETVASPIEQQVNGVENMLYMASNCNSDGSYQLTITFELGTDIDIAQVLVQNRVSLAEPRLPEEVKRQGLTVNKQSTSYVVIASLFSPNNQFDSLYLANYATLQIKDVLARIPGVGSVNIFPLNKDYGMRVWLNPEKMQTRNLTTLDVVNALKEQNVQVAAGQIGQPPVPPGQRFQFPITTLGRLSDVSQFKDIFITPGEGGRITRLRDVADVELGGQTYDTTSTLNGKPSCTIIVYQLPGSNALQVAKEVKKTMATLKGQFPKGLEYDMNYDVTDFVMASIDEVVKTLLEAFTLVVLVVFVFLQNWRATLIPIITIPVAIIGTFAVMAGMGFSINMLTLFGLVLAIGIVVDDAIVVVENVERVMAESHLAPREATIQAMAEVTTPIIGITLVLMSVFIPTAFMPGITGQMYRQFALTIAATTFFSAVNALTLSPALCALFLKPHEKGHRKNIFFRGFNHVFDWVQVGYRKTVSLAVRVILISLVVYAGLVGLAVFGLASLPTGFVPLEDQGLVLLNLQLPDSSSLERTVEVLNKIQAIAKQTPGVVNVTVLGGYSLLDGTYGSNFGGGFISLKPWEERYEEAHIEKQSLQGILDALNREFAGIPEGVAFAFSMPPIQGLGFAGGFQMQVLDKTGLGLNALQEATMDIIRQADTEPEVTQVNTRFRAAAPQLFLDIDRTKAKTLGIPLQWVFDTLQAYLGSVYVNDFNKFGRVYQVKVQAESQFRASTKDISRLYVRNQQGRMIPLSTVVKAEQRLGPSVISRYNLYTTAAINGQASPGFSSGEAMNTMERVAASVLPEGMGFDWTAISFQEKRVGSQAIFIFLLAIVTVFLLLAAQYESWTNPFAVILAVPLAILGAAVGTYIRGLDLNVFTQIGLVLLIGLAAKNAILIVEFAREAKAKGQGLSDAAVNGATLRFRPILMTSFAFIFGVFPLVVATGAGAAGRVALGTAVFSGMIAATIFPIFLVPVLYVVFQGLSERLGKKRDHGH